MHKAIWNEKGIAESDDVVELEGNIYFPANSVNRGSYPIAIIPPYVPGRVWQVTSM